MLSSAITPARATPAIAAASVTPTPSRSYRWGVVSALALLFFIGLTIVWQLQPADDWRTRLASGRTERVTHFEGDEGDAAISPDGRLWVFLAAREGTFDVWVDQFVLRTLSTSRKAGFGHRIPLGLRFDELVSSTTVRSGFQKARDPVPIAFIRRQCMAANHSSFWMA